MRSTASFLSFSTRKFLSCWRIASLFGSELSAAEPVLKTILPGSWMEPPFCSTPELAGAGVVGVLAVAAGSVGLVPFGSGGGVVVASGAGAVAAGAAVAG